jgi:hypothetical protein
LKWKSGFVNIFHSPITIEEMFNRERVILTIEPQAILWYRGIVLYGSIGLPRPNSLNALTLGAICVRQSAYRSNDEPLPLHPSEKEIRILIADDHPIVCEGLIAVFALEDDLKVRVDSLSERRISSARTHRGSASLPSPFGDHTFTGPDHQYLETA